MIYEMDLLVFLSTVFVLLLVRSALDWKARSRGAPLPPGPRPLPVLGNLLDFPRFKPWVGFRTMRQQYGDLIYLQVPRQRILVIGSAKVATEFLEKRSANSSDRPHNIVFDLSGILETNFASIGYGSRWRACRRTFWQYFHPGVVSDYRLAQHTETTKVLAKLLESPARLRSHLRQLFSATMLKVLYDIDVTSEDDHHVQIVDDSLEAAALAIPGSFAVEAFPLLRHVPAWFPGANSQRLFLRSKQANLYLKHKSFDDVQQSVASGKLHSCVVTRMLARASVSLGVEAASLPGDELDHLKVTCSTAFEGGADTTFSTLQGLFVALALNPHVQKKAQAELDAVVGPHRLPCHEDTEALLYVNAIVKEILRWHNVLPMGIPHRTVEDDVFCGHFIPAGTTVLTNVWDILHDPDTYEKPDDFNPDRFIRDGKMNPDVQDHQTIMFGFGRRKCPGRYFANDSLFITISSILHVFNITLPLDEHGDPIKVEYRQSHGFLSYPEDIRCTVRPRSAAAEALIRNAMTGIPAGCGESTGYR